MQFKRKQRDALLRSWHGGSWFYTSLGPPARSIVEQAYELPDGVIVPNSQKARAQDDLTVIMAIFARRIGCDKSHAVHALLSGSIESLQKALIRAGQRADKGHLLKAWESSFRDVSLGQ